jgi:hypothetical protein
MGQAQSFMRGGPNELNRSFEIPQHLLIRQTQHEITARGKPGVPPRVVPLPRLKVMSLAIKLDDKTRGVAHEIRDVNAHRHLATKAEAIKMMGLEISPEKALRSRHRLAKTLGPLALRVSHKITWHFPLPIPPPQAGEGGACGPLFANRSALTCGTL